MKLYKILLLGGISFLASSCAEDVEPSIPQQNPQEPIVALEDITSEKAGVLASDAVLNLEDYRADGSLIPVMKLVKADSLPEGATISYKLELSNTDSFQREEILNTVAGTPAEDGTTVYSVSANDWNDAHLALFGKSPKEKVVYYRVPAYINVNGSDYRLNSVDYYVAEGIIKVEGKNPGYVVEKNYYLLLGDMTEWNLNDADADKKYPFAQVRPENDIYDDPNFSITLDVTRAMLEANGGSLQWRIAPESTVGTSNWTGVYGAETPDDTSLEGTLVEGGENGLINKAGNYKFEINLETLAYTITFISSDKPRNLYLIGQPSGWNIDNGAMAAVETGVETNIYSGVFYVPAGGFQFRFYKALGNWDAGSIGAQVADSTVDISMTDGKYSGECFEGKGSWQLPGWEGGMVEVIINLNDMTIEMTKVQPRKMYVIGACSGWNIDNDQVFLTEVETTPNIYKGTLDIEKGQFMFRFYSELGNWDANSIGSQQQDSAVDITLKDGKYTGSCVYGKGSWNVASWEGGKVNVTLDMNTNEVTFEAE